MDARPALPGPDRALELEHVLAHADWLRALARRLVNDADEADDLAQEAWIAFDAQQPDTERGVKPWLAAVVRKLALRRRRDRARRERREHDAARDEALPSSAELAADHELRALVGRALVELDEPFRGTLILRYFAGLEPTEIAAREGVPAATVRTRVKRGLDKLREALDRRTGGRAAWAGLFVRLLDPESRTPALAGPLAGGVIVMNLTWKIAAAALLVAATGVLGWLIVNDARKSDVPLAGDRSAGGTALAADVGSAPIVVDATDSASREQLARPDHAPAPEQVQEPAVTRVHARIVAEGGAPLAGATLAAFGTRTGSRDDEVAIGEARSDERGEIELPLAPLVRDVDGNYTCTLVARKSGFATARLVVKLAHAPRTEASDVVLARACVLAGRVEGLDGVALGGATVTCGPAAIRERDPARLRLNGPDYDAEAAWIARATTDASGRFVLDDATPGVVRVWSVASGRAWTSTEPLELRPGERRDGIVLRLESLAGEDTITGIVLSPAGEPVTKARVQAAYEWAEGGTSLSTTTDERGRFSFHVETPVPHELRVTDDARRWGTVVRGPVQPGTHDYEVRFAPTRALEIRATHAHAPVEPFSVRIEQHERLVRGISLGPLAFADETQSAGGVVRTVVPSATFDVEIDAPGFELARRGPFDETSAPDVLACELVPLPGVRGRVALGDVPASDVRVELLSWHSGAGLWKNGYQVQYGGMEEIGATPADDGTFLLHLRDDGRYVVRARVTGARAHEYAPAELGPLALVARTGASGLELALLHGGTIEGRVIVGAGESAAGRVVGLNHGDANPRTVRTDAEGRFRVEHLAPGGWQVLSAQEEVDPSRTVWSYVTQAEDARDLDDWTCTVTNGATTRVDVDLRAHGAGTLDGRVSGLAGDGWSATLVRDETAGSARADALSASVAPDGRFHFDFTRGGAAELRFTGPGEPGRALRITTRVELAPGANRWDERVELASLRGEGFVSAATGVVFEYASYGTFSASCRIVPDARGRFELPHVLAGRGEVRRYTPSTSAGVAAEWTSLTSFETHAGATLDVRAP